MLIYITCPDREVAKTIARALVEEKLIACANILDGLTSVYRWDGNIEESSEVLLLAKTEASKWKQLEKRVLELHPYDVPCVVAYPSAETTSIFAHWVRSSVCSKEISKE